MKCAASKNSGFTLIALLTAVGIIGLLLFAVFRTLTNSFNAAARIDHDMEKLALQRFLFAATDCAKSYENLTCPSQDFVTLRRKSGAVLVASIGTKFGSLTARAECNAGNDGVLVRVARLKAGGTLRSTAENDFQKDPLTRKIVTWESPQSLLQLQGTDLCSETGEQRVKVYGSSFEKTNIRRKVARKYGAFYGFGRPASEPFEIKLQDPLPDILTTSKTRVHVDFSGNINHDHPPGKRCTNWVNFVPVLMYSQDNGQNWLKQSPVAVTVHNGGTDFSRPWSFEVPDASHVLVKTYIGYLIEKPSPKHCVDDFAVVGALKITAVDLPP